MGNVTAANVVTDYGADPTGTNDSTAAIQAALNSGTRLVYLPNGDYKTTAPLTVQANSGTEILGGSALKKTVIHAEMPASPATDDAAIQYLATGGTNFAGLTIRNIHLIGNLPGRHGIRIQDSAYVLIENCIIEQFHGAGLLLDKVQDSSFNNLSIQQCGRTSGNYNLIGDVTNNALTQYSALTLVSSVQGDHCNMLRFNDMQIEANLVSPYVWVKDPSVIGIYFNNLHAEVRLQTQWNLFDLFRLDGGDYEFYGIASSRFRNGFLFYGYGYSRFANSRDLGNVRHMQANVNGSFAMTNCRLNDLSWTALGGPSQFVNCVMRDINIDYPAAGPTVFANCVAEDVVIQFAGAPHSGVRFVNCMLATYTAAQTAVDQVLVDSVVTGPISSLAGGSSHVRTYGTSAPVGGNWPRGAVVWNTAPVSGGYAGWICVASPSTWKQFGKIL